MKKGFTLVELSIVLVIIGLLVGEILVGQSLITSAQLNAMVRQFAQYDAAIFSFKSKYKQIPGDSWLSSTVAALAPDAASRDGIITDNDRINNTLRYAAAGSEEYMLFWYELVALSQLKIENCSNLLTRGDVFAGGNGIRIKGANCNFPDVKFGAGSATTIIAAAYDTNGSPIYPSNSAGNAFYIVDNCNLNGAGPEFSCTAGFTPTEALSFDAKTDDGIPNTGDVEAFSDVTITSARRSGKTFPAAYVNVATNTKLSLLRKFPKGLQ